MPAPEAISAALEAVGVPFEIIDVDPRLPDTDNFCLHYG